MLYVVYTGEGNTIVTTREEERETVRRFFGGRSGRNKENYSRSEIKSTHVIVYTEMFAE